MGDVVRNKILRCRLLLTLCLLLCIAAAGYCLWCYEQRNVDVGLVRVEANQLLWDLEQGKSPASIHSTYPYAFIDLYGGVIYSTIENIVPGERMDVHVLGDINRYLVPVMIGGKTEAFLLVDFVKQQKTIARRHFFQDVLIFVGILGVCVILGLWLRKIEKEDIWEPIQDIHKSTKSILRGDFDTRVTYDYDGEIGTLCADFECMRDELQAAMERERRVKEKERSLYASISHDLKTPIASITGYLEEILYGVITQPEEVHQAMERMLEKSMTLKGLIEDILEHSKASLNQLSIEKEDVYARDYFEELLSGYAKDAKLSDYEFEYELPENLMIHIDSRRIAQVIQNLIDNSVKYRDGKLKIQVGFQQIEGPEKLLIVEVADNGTGIDAADQPFIFDMFFRGNKERTQEIKGSGIGLNIARYIVEQHHGQIECDSILGHGTKISFSIPIK